MRRSLLLFGLPCATLAMGIADAISSPLAFQTAQEVWDSKPVRLPAISALGGGTTCPPIGVNLCVPLDAQFELVDFGSFDPCQRNDDGSGQHTLNGWQFDHFGQLTSGFFINNNGNLSIGQPFETYTPSGFPVAGFPMLAPFWGDVDTLDAGSGLVWKREWSTSAGDAVNRLVITWDHVGYYDESSDKRNTFQIIVTDGNDPLIGFGNNVCFCYDDMQWTTGDASNGTGGLGGSPATVGANQGNGTDFFLIGLFDHEGTDYDGPGGVVDGVSYLDDSTFCFSVAGAGANAAPVFLNPPACPLEVSLGGTLTFDVQAIGPELGQTVTLQVDPQGLAGFSSSVLPGNPSVAACTFAPTQANLLGVQTVRFTATDDGTPVGTTTIEVQVEVLAGPGLGSTYCNSTSNSTGAVADIGMYGSPLAIDNNLQLVATALPADQLVLFLASGTQGMSVMPGTHSGVLCLGGSIARFNGQIGMATSCGRASIGVDMLDVPANPSTPILAGETWNFQAWFRDSAVNGSNFTNAASAAFQ